MTRPSSGDLQKKSCFIRMGLNIRMFEEEGQEEFQDLVLTIHHCYMHVFMNSHSYKLIENHEGAAIIKGESQTNHR